MYIVKQDNFEIIDFYQKKINYTSVFVSEELQPFFPCAGNIEPTSRLKEFGFDFIFEDSENIKLIIEYSEITVGKIAHLAYLISKTEIEQLSNMIHSKYMEIVEKDIFDILPEVNLSKHFFKMLNPKTNNQDEK